jgi:hypothetical protein
MLHIDSASIRADLKEQWIWYLLLLLFMVGLRAWSGRVGFELLLLPPAAAIGIALRYLWNGWLWIGRE